MEKLLSRDEFREGVFKRDGHKCVVCKEPAADAHHIIERRLFPDGGYYLDNGASVCGECHIKAEETTISCDDLREACGIKTAILPPHLYRDQMYDKWGNPILSNGNRLPGDLFNDASVQKILAPVLHLFDKRVKYPRTYHLPWSPGATKDDRVLSEDETQAAFGGKEIVITEKMDGENTTMYSSCLHARSTDYEHHPSRSWVRALHARIAYDIPEGWRVCGENCFAKHSIKYENLEDYFLMFSIWNDKNICLDWDQTKEWAQLLGLKMVPAIFEGKMEDSKINLSKFDFDKIEGYVIRVRDSFHYSQFRKSVGKYVRKNHVQTHGHWMRNAVEPNKVKS
jgi:hypothetical protein